MTTTLGMAAGRARLGMRGVAAIVFGAAALLGGCAADPSVWEQGFVREDGGARAALQAQTPVRVRAVPFERVEQFMNELDAEVAASDVPRTQWAPDKKQAAEAKLLRGLQVTADPASVDVVGVSRFRTTDDLRPDSRDQPALMSFARDVGANEVVWTTRYLGKADKIVEKPVTRIGGSRGYWGNGWYGEWGSGGDWGGSSTTWVPVRVQADERMFVLFFLRNSDLPGEDAPAGGQ